MMISYRDRELFTVGHYWTKTRDAYRRDVGWTGTHASLHCTTVCSVQAAGLAVALWLVDRET